MTDVSISTVPAPLHDRISAFEVRKLLAALDGVTFADPAHFDLVHHVLTDLAWWDDRQHDDELAIAWIKRIHPEVHKLPIENPLYGKALRRLRTLCGRTPNLPPLFEVTETFEQDPGPPLFCTTISDVHKARNAHRVVALKTVRSSVEDSETYKRMFRKEAIVWQLLRHDHIVPFLGILGRNDSLQLVSVWMENGQLTKYLREHPEENPLRFIRHVLNGLQHIHSIGMAHGDIKGANILVDADRNARIADFGVTVALQSTGLATQPGSRGTAAYKAPEIIDTGDQPTDWTGLPTRESDIYAMAVLIWELYAGQIPFKGKSDVSIQMQTMFGKRLLRADGGQLNLPAMDPLWAIMQRGWHKDPAQRCSLAEMDTVVQRLQSDP